MPPKKAAKLPVVKAKQVRFSKSKKADEEETNENILKNAPKPEEYEPKSELDFTDEELTKQNELEKELETEIEEETEADEDEKEEQDETEKDEDHEIDDDVEYEGDKDDEGLEGVDNIDDLYDEDKPKKKKLKKIAEDEDEELEDDMCDYDYGEIYDEKKEEPMIIVEDNKRITFPKLTKYERVRLIGSRAKQISLGAKVLIKNTNGLSPIEIAKLELIERMIPMKIKRILPDNKVEIWKLSELEIEN
jgi:DNA-directed RNA polymerase I, II, and III subunit RPABC2